MTPLGIPVPPARSRAWGWLAHLRDGGTTAWADWTAEAEPAGPALPGAQQLELLRRLNLAGRPSDALRAQVLDSVAAGRGSQDLPLAGDGPTPAFGPRPVDPGALPPGELLRVATSVLAQQLVTLGTPPGPPARRAWPWRRRYRLLGDPALVVPLRRALLERGRPPGGTGARVWIAGTALDRMLGDVWTERCFGLGVGTWTAWVGGLEQHRRVPDRVDLPRIAEHWARLAGPHRVSVVLTPGALPGLLGAPPAPPATVSADAAELARRLGPVLALLLPEARRARLLHEVLRPRLARLAGDPPGLPEAQRAWAEQRARRMGHALARGDYAVVGDPQLVLPDGRGTLPTGAGALEVAVRVLREGLE